MRAACQRHLDDLDLQKERGIQWRPTRAEAAIKFIEKCLFIDEGKPFLLHDFQAFIVGCIFGWYNIEGFRRFRTAYVEMGKGNGKTPLAAAVALYGLVVDNEPAPEVYSAATARDQATICFKDACRLQALSPELAHVEQRVGSLTISSRFAVFRPLSSEHRQLDGKRPHIAIIDEVHEHPTPIVVDKIRAGTKNRRNALIFEITNSGYDTKSVCYKHHDYSIKILQGILTNEAWFAYVCAVDEADEDNALTNEKCWIKANPGLGTILPLSYLREQMREARDMPSKESIVKRLNLCIWTEQASRWITLKDWRACNEPVDPEELAGCGCFGGLDLATTLDIAAFVLLFPDDIGAQLLPFFFCPEDTIHARSQRDQVPYDLWARQGFLIKTPGNLIDYDFIRAKIKDLGELYNIREIAFDRWNASQIVTQLGGDGFNMVQFGQGYGSMSAPSKEFEKWIIGRRIAHGGNPVLEWMASNVTIEKDAAGNIKPSKAKSIEKIDGIVATIMAMGRLIVTPDGENSSVYASRGIQTI